NEAINIKNYLTEARIVSASTVLGKTVADLIKLSGGDAIVTSILRNRTMRMTPLPDVVLKVNDILLLEGDPEALDRLVSQGKLSVTGNRVGGDATASEMVAIEAVIGESSSLIGWSAQRLALYD
ncbi:MAG: SLC13 family permease, partial [Mesorhizobium sp.]